MVLPSLTSTAPSVHFTYPSTSLLNYKASSNPEALSPPVSSFAFARPFNIESELYNRVLHPAVPIVTAIFYAICVAYANSYNKKRDYKPWPISKTLAFYLLVITHNIFLSLYSGWTCFGMFNAIRHSWPGFNGPDGLAGVADALCKMHGPRGMGSAATYDISATEWTVTDRAIKLAQSQPDATDVGRIWNEGLAFYGWLFYLSKFYELMDTAIILAKGKRSSTLQTFHHSGAMLCMWAGIRYMSPPIWMFVFINSGLHALMYTYYTFAALTIRVPRAMKQTLTTLQIVQIVVGGTYAFSHLFVAYDIPIEKPYLFIHNLSTALPSGASTLSSTVSSAFASATATAGLGSWLKKIALRAAGEEGLAENVRNYRGETFGIDAIHAAEMEKAQEEIRYKLGTQRIHCLDTSGEAFAILLNLIYLAPLAVLFIRYFTRSYLGRAKSEPPKPSAQENIKESSKVAVRDVEREIREAMTGEQGGITEPPPELKEKLEKAKGHAKQGTSDFGTKAQQNAKNISAKTQQGASELSNKAQKTAHDVSVKAQKSANSAKEAFDESSAMETLKEKMKKMGEEKKKSASSFWSTSKNTATSKSRDPSPKKPAKPDTERTGEEDGEKADDEPVKEEPEENEPEEVNGDASAYEAIPDEPKTEEEVKAEAEMQPDQG